MKMFYESPEQEIVILENEDIIITSALEHTTLPTMGNAGDSNDWGDGDRIHFDDLLGNN